MHLLYVDTDCCYCFIIAETWHQLKPFGRISTTHMKKCITNNKRRGPPTDLSLCLFLVQLCGQQCDTDLESSAVQIRSAARPEKPNLPNKLFFMFSSFGLDPSVVALKKQLNETQIYSLRVCAYIAWVWQSRSLAEKSSPMTNGREKWRHAGKLLPEELGPILRLPVATIGVIKC